ncbi:IS66 family transposase [Sulfurimonas sp. SAG-AH-194-C21]|nr:IS66 family transposase [Sulfurimonas sp. SAG-AH-194-C21]
MKNSHIKYQFSIKSESELEGLSHDELLEYIKNLQKNIVQEKPPKNSNNSSISPSSEIAPPANKKNQSLREKSDKDVGGQKGRVGTTLIQRDTPHEIINLPYSLTACKKCAIDLSAVIAKAKERRQVLDIELSKIETKITEYQSFSKVCPECGYDNHDSSAFSVAPNISYGVTIIAMVSYLSVSQYMSNVRIVSLLENLFGIVISEGSITSLLAKAAKLSLDEISKIQKALEAAALVGIDETGCKVDGKKHWHWTFQNEDNTLIVADKSRGTKVITNTFENGFMNACVVHDNYSSYNGLICESEQLCLAHKMRDLNYAIDCEDTKLMKGIKELLKEAIRDDKESLSTQQRVHLKVQYDKSLQHLLSMPTIENSESHKQVKSFTKSKNKIFTFLLDENIPADNNGSERAIRNIKVKQKVSGQFKSLSGAQNYATLRSIVDTSRKRGLNEFESLVSVIQGNSLF